MWIWEQQTWPNFEYDLDKILPSLERAVRNISPLMTLANQLDETKRLQLESQVMLDEALSTAKIEGELLDRESVRSSIANRLGIGQTTRPSKSSQAFIDVLLESIRSADQPLKESELFKWQHMLFIEKPMLHDLIIGDYRHDTMQVVSGRHGKQTIHFEAPCSNRECVQQEMNTFFDYLNSEEALSGYIKAAIAKFWFVTIHPFDDGNGRFSRIIAERLLVKADNTTLRLYSLSTEIEKHKNDYYEILEKTQKGDLNLTEWIIWFLNQISASAEASLSKLQKIQQSTLFWDRNRDINLNERQRKLITRLLETDDFAEGVSRRKYKNLVGASDATAARDLKELLELGILKVDGAGRSTKYFIV
jgi:Fic family protein